MTLWPFVTRRRLQQELDLLADRLTTERDAQARAHEAQMKRLEVTHENHKTALRALARALGMKEEK